MKKTGPFFARFARFIKNKQCCGNAGPVEEVCRQSDHAIKQIFPNDGFANFSFLPTPEEHSMGDDHPDAPFVGYRGGNHVADERPVPFAFRRYTATKAV